MSDAQRKGSTASHKARARNEPLVSAGRSVSTSSRSVARAGGRLILTCRLRTVTGAPGKSRVFPVGVDTPSAAGAISRGDSPSIRLGCTPLLGRLAVGGVDLLPYLVLRHPCLRRLLRCRLRRGPCAHRSPSRTAAGQ